MTGADPERTPGDGLGQGRVAERPAGGAGGLSGVPGHLRPSGSGRRGERRVAALTEVQNVGLGE